MLCKSDYSVHNDESLLGYYGPTKFNARRVRKRDKKVRRDASLSIFKNKVDRHLRVNWGAKMSTKTLTPSGHRGQPVWSRWHLVNLVSLWCQGQGGGDAWISLECHDVSYFTKTLYVKITLKLIPARGTPLFPPDISQKISQCSPGIRRMALVLKCAPTSQI